MAGTIVANTINTDAGLFSTQNAYQGIAKAWVNFNGVTTATIRSSFNVSSITRTSTGIYTVNFTTALPDTNYCALNCAGGTASVVGGVSYENVTARTTSSFTFYTYNTSFVFADAAYCNIAIFSA